MRIADVDGALDATLASIGIASLYRASSPPLDVLRARNPGDDSGRQALMDTDILCFGLAFFVGIMLYFVTHSLWPLNMLLLTIAIVSWWHHQILAGANWHVERIS